MLHVVTWLWGTKWPPHYVERLAAGLRRNLKQRYRFVLVTDQPISTISAHHVCGIAAEDRVYLDRLGCLVRMRMFDKEWQAANDMNPGDRIVNIDVDCVVTDTVDPLFDRDDEFTIMQGFNTTNPCPFNGSLWMFRAGERHDVWDDFGPDAHAKYNVPIHAIADDQGWLHHKFPFAKAYTPEVGVYCFKKRTWPTGDMSLPKGARIVAFPGRKPEQYPGLEWVQRHWRC